MSNPSSPCILVCSIDQQTGYCFGCGRTGTEITGWLEYSQGQRLDIMAGLEARLATIVRKPRRITKRRQRATLRNPNDNAAN